MAGSVRFHVEAAARHESAAATHERAAVFWEELGNRARSDLHRDAALHELAGAALERRWADLVAGEDARDAAARDPQQPAGSAVEESPDAKAVPDR